MSAQTSYNFLPPIGAAGGLVDLSPKAIDTFINEEANGVMGFGLAVVDGTTAGVDVKLPTASTGKFEGVTINNRTTEHALHSSLVNVLNKAAIGVIRYGKVYVQLAEGATPEFGDPVYYSYTGANKGKFTDSSSSTVAINARFISAANNGIAAIELQQENIVDAT